MSKCRAKGGPAACRSHNCPEKQAQLALLENLTDPQQIQARLNDTSWLDPEAVLLKTKHGSRLYGLNHADSDEDWWIVRPTKRTTRKRNIQHGITGDQDVTELDFATFAQMAAEGVPQAVEAMFAAEPEISHIEHFRTAFYAAGPEQRDRYMRTIRKFARSDDLKQKRHAVRLTMNLANLMDAQRFNPTLNDTQKREANRIAALDGEAYLEELQKCIPIDLGFREDERDN